MTWSGAVGSRTVVGVCTYRRPQLLQTCLDSLEAQGAGDLFAVVVVDNSPDAGARESVQARGWADYVHEPRPGIAHARNASVRRALDLGAEFLIFVDDDSVVGDGWPGALVAFADRTGADAVAGAVVSRFPPATPAWLRGSAPYNLRRHPTGTRVPEAATANLLMRTSLFASRPSTAWFAPALGLSGGSDTDLTRRLVAEGATILWCDESVVEEIVPPERATAMWCLRRGARTAGIHTLLQHPSGVVPVLRVTAGGLARVVVGSALSLASVAAPRVRGRGLWTLGRGIGVLAALRGHVLTEYRR
jgi:succinoglycan biosynthesis protein ExoM